MKNNIDYSNDERWSLCSDLHKKFGVSPNWFLSVLLKSEIEYLKDINIVIETGTFEGYTTKFFANHFEEVHSIEKFVNNNSYSSDNLLLFHEKIKKDFKNVNFHYGDSEEVLKEILKSINDKPCVILLDAHNGSSTPIKKELISIKNNLKNKKSIIMIDDCLDAGTGDWPSLNELKNLIMDINPNFKIKHTGLGRDIIICYE